MLESTRSGVAVKTSSSVPPILRFGVFELDPRAGELRKKGMKIRLQGQPVEILVMLLQRPGETITMLCSGISEAIASLTPSLCCFGHFVLRKCSAFGWHSKIGNTVTENP